MQAKHEIQVQSGLYIALQKSERKSILICDNLLHKTTHKGKEEKKGRFTCLW